MAKDKFYLQSQLLPALSYLTYHQFDCLSWNGTNWYGCREHFHQNQPVEANAIFFECPANIRKAENVADLVKQMEILLNIKEEFHSKVFQCENSGHNHDIGPVIKAELSSFWLKNIARTYFFTILLRCVTFSDKNADVIDCIKQDKRYVHYTKQAVYRFLTGRTALSKKVDKNNIDGWMNYFYGSNHREIYLVYPKKKDLFNNETARSNLTLEQTVSLKKWAGIKKE